MPSAKQQILKTDLFGQIVWIQNEGKSWIRRDVGKAHWSLRWFARWAAGKEARALRALQGLRNLPQLIHYDGKVLDRTHIAGLPMQEARPRNPEYFRAARHLVIAMHRLNVAHNDLAKEPNWLVTDDGQPAIVDFQLAWISPKRSRFFRMLAREDLRHLLKHKRFYRADLLTPIEKRVLAKRSWIGRWWKASGKKVYRFITRKIFGWQDNEGKG